MTRKLLSLVATLTVVVGAMALGAPASSAQTTPTYQGQCSVTTGSSNAGAFNIGQTFTLRVSPTCVFTPGSVVTVTVNGVSVPGKVADASGVVSVTITVLSATQISVDDPVTVASQCGGNSVVAVGTSSVAGGNTVTQSVGFTINCPAAPATASKGTVAFTGANVARWSAVALVLVVAGFGLTLFSRQRKRAGSAISA